MKTLIPSYDGKNSVSKSVTAGELKTSYIIMIMVSQANIIIIRGYLHLLLINIRINRVSI